MDLWEESVVLPKTSVQELYLTSTDQKCRRYCLSIFVDTFVSRILCSLLRVVDQNIACSFSWLVGPNPSPFWSVCFVVVSWQNVRPPSVLSLPRSPPFGSCGTSGSIQQSKSIIVLFHVRFVVSRFSPLRHLFGSWGMSRPKDTHECRRSGSSHHRTQEFFLFLIHRRMIVHYY